MYNNNNNVTFLTVPENTFLLTQLRTYLRFFALKTSYDSETDSHINDGAQFEQPFWQEKR